MTGTGQLPMFFTGSGGLQTPAEPLQAKLLHRTSDPVTSVKAAAQAADRLTKEQRYVLYLITAMGPGTAMEIAERTVAFDVLLAADPLSVDSVYRRYHRIMRRTGELKRAGAIEVKGEERDGRQVLRVTEG